MDISSIRSTTGPAPAAQPPVPPEQASQRRELIRAAGVINASQALGANTELVFVVDRNTHKAIMRVIDRNTKEVVMQLPAEYVLRLAEDAKTIQHDPSIF